MVVLYFPLAMVFTSGALLKQPLHEEPVLPMALQAGLPPYVMFLMLL